MSSDVEQPTPEAEVAQAGLQATMRIQRGLQANDTREVLDGFKQLMIINPATPIDFQRIIGD